MNAFTIKKILACIMDVLGINSVMLKRLSKKYDNNYIRVVNYHDTPPGELRKFEKQILWYNKKFQNVDMKSFEEYMAGKKHFENKPGIMITFDDGFINNMQAAKEILDKYGFTGYFFVSSALVGEDGYMSWDMLKELLSDGHVIGCHTATHHRMNEQDTQEILEAEIVESKHTLEYNLGVEIPIFCWCGGEEMHYTKKAANMIREAGYRYGFMTNSSPVIHETDSFQIERTNIETSWSNSLLRFQISGGIDRRMKDKRNRVEQLTKQ